MNLALTPLKKEMQGIAEGLQKQGLQLIKNQHKGRWYYEIPELNLFLTTAGHGKAQFALVAQSWLSYFDQVSALLCLGAAGALDDELRIGDIVIASRTIEHDYKEVCNPHGNLPEFPLNYDVFKKKFDTSGWNMKLHRGCIASGDEDIVSAQRAQELVLKTGAVAAAWEGAGAARVAQWNKLSFAEIRCITDRASGDVGVDFFQNLPLAMNHISWLLKEALTSIEPS